MVPPLSTMSCCSSMRSMTGAGVNLSNSVELAPSKPGQVTGGVDDHDLEAQAEPETGDVVFPGVAGGRHLALDAPLAEAAGDDDAVELLEAVALDPAVHLLGRVDPGELDLGRVVEAGVTQRLDHREVGVGQAHVLAHHPDADRPPGRLHQGGHLFPAATGRPGGGRRRWPGSGRRPGRVPPRGGPGGSRRCWGRRRPR